MNRRTILGGLATAAACPGVIGGETSPSAGRFGVQSFSCTARIRAHPELRDPEAFLRYCRGLGAGGVQMPIPRLEPEPLRRLRGFLDTTGMWLEGSVRLPGDGDVERFEADLRAAGAAGAGLVRTVLLSGRRYEVFTSKSEFDRFRDEARRSLERAVPVVRRLGLRLAVENHKDFRSVELLDLLRRIGCADVGITLDTGNNLALLEPPHETVERLAPLAFAVHLKDMAAEEHAEGYLISEVPFGIGFIDLKAVTDLVRRHQTQTRFSIEMATRDPLVVPCLAERYWATMGDLPASVLAAALSFVRARKEGRPLPRVSGLPPAELVRVEEANLRACLLTCRTRLANPRPD